MSAHRQGWLTNATPPAWVMRLGMNWWAPFRGARIRCEVLAPDFRYARMAMPLKLANRNIWGVHFGGSLFAMTDAVFGILLKRNLGADYSVWDKHATIDFRKPGRGRVYCEFRIDQPLLDSIRVLTADGAKHLPEFTVQIFDAQGDVVAEVVKTLYVRKLLPRPAAVSES